MQCDSPREASPKAHRQKIWILGLVSVLLLLWLNYIAIVLNMGSARSIFTYPLSPITASFGAALNIAHTIHACRRYTRTLLQLFELENRATRSPLFVSKAIVLSNAHNATNSVSEVARLRALRLVEHALLDAQKSFTVTESLRLAVIDQSSRYLLKTSSVLDDTTLAYTGHVWQYEINQTLALSPSDETSSTAEVIDEEQPKSQDLQQALQDAVEAKIETLTDKATGVSFNPKLDSGLYLIGVGVRKKSIISIYAVAMYASPSVLKAISAFPKKGQENVVQTALRDAARTFDSTSPTTSFVLNMVYKADASTIAAAIADSVKPRYSGDVANVERLESLIFE
jgi:hypothetical protein